MQRWKSIPAPKIGANAIHISGNLDGRIVADISDAGQEIKLMLFGSTTGWLPAKNYNFFERVEDVQEPDGTTAGDHRA